MGETNPSKENNNLNDPGNKPTKSKKTMWIVIAIVIILILLALWFFGMNSGGMPSTGGPSYY